jgi:hypothetical protein
MSSWTDALDLNAIVADVISSLANHHQIPTFSRSPRGLSVPDAYRLTALLRAAFEARGEKQDWVHEPQRPQSLNSANRNEPGSEIRETWTRTADQEALVRMTSDLGNGSPGLGSKYPPSGVSGCSRWESVSIPIFVNRETSGRSFCPTRRGQQWPIAISPYVWYGFMYENYSQHR